MATRYSDAGYEIIDCIHVAQRFVSWMYAVVRPHLYGNILEIGSGRGTYSERLTRDFPGSKLIFSDIDPDYVRQLRQKFRSNKDVTVLLLDMGKPADYGKIRQRVDSVFALNVLEHIKDDVAALKHIYGILPKNGRCVILVPAHKMLYNTIDVALRHYRRYSKREVVEKAKLANFRIRHLSYFNFVAVLGWFVNGNLMRKKVFSYTGMQTLNALVPVLQFIEKHILRNSFGISILAVLEKPGD
ncbi:class I SAM-dependent methyltransferase [Candidatus Woesearchaeota archaeon]|nr:class I SAM-dependent methyltransferase [Candidatus Woesearchaeota archaeon]